MSFFRKLFGGSGHKIKGINAAKQYFEDATSSFSLGMDSMMLGMGGACSVNFHICIDKCCAAIYSFSHIPPGFGDSAGQHLMDLYETKLQGRKELSSYALKTIESVAQIGIKYGSAAMSRIPTSQLSNINFLKQLGSAAEECMRQTKQLLDSLAL